MVTYMYERKKGLWIGTKAKSKKKALKTFKKQNSNVRMRQVKLLRKPRRK